MYLPLESLLERELHGVFTEIYLKKGNCKKIVKIPTLTNLNKMFTKRKTKTSTITPRKKVLRLVTIYYILASAILVENDHIK